MPTTTDLLDIRGTGQRGMSFRFDWLDNDETKLGELHPVRGDDTATITCDTTRSVLCDVANLNLIPSEAARIDQLRHRLKPYVVLEDGSEYPLGVYVWANSSAVRQSWGLPLVSSLVDKGIALNQPTSTTASFPAGTSIRQAIIRVLRGAGVAGIVDSTEATLAAPLMWPAGTMRWQIVANLCTLGGYLTPFFDMEGVCFVSVAPDFMNLPEPMVSFEDGRNIYAATPVETNDLLSTPNRFTVIGNSATGAEVVGTYDVPSTAPYSYFNRGFIVSEVINQQGVASAADAVTAAKAYALSRQIYEHVTFACAPDPRVDVYGTIEYLGERWLVQAWSMTLAPGGPMTITARKVYS